MATNCAVCGADVPDGAQFCPQCGARVNGPATAGAADSPANGGAGNGGVAGAARAAGGRGMRADEPEAQLWRGGYSGKSMIGAWAGAGALTVVLLILGLVMTLAPFVWAAIGVVLVGLWAVLFGLLGYHKFSVSYTLTTQRFVHERGLLSRRTDRIEVIDIDDVTFEQGLVERFLNVGTIELTSSDRTDPKLILRGIDDVKRVAGLIDEARRQERRKRGLYVEQV